MIGVHEWTLVWMIHTESACAKITADQSGELDVDAHVLYSILIAVCAGCQVNALQGQKIL